MMATLEHLWQACPGETAVYGAAALGCAALLAICIAALIWPQEPDGMEET